MVLRDGEQKVKGYRFFLMLTFRYRPRQPSTGSKDTQWIGRYITKSKRLEANHCCLYVSHSYLIKSALWCIRDRRSNLMG